MISLFVRIALLALSLVPSQSLVGLQPTSFQDHPPLERFQLVDPLLSSRVFSAGTWTKWNSSDDPRKESVSKQGCYLKKKYHSSILITRCLAIWTFQCLHLVLTPPYHLPLVTFAFFRRWLGSCFSFQVVPLLTYQGLHLLENFLLLVKILFHFTILLKSPDGLAHRVVVINSLSRSIWWILWGRPLQCWLWTYSVSSSEFLFSFVEFLEILIFL